MDNTPRPAARILVAEDNPVSAGHLLGLLRRAGFDACLAGDGLEAIGRLEADQFDLVLMDVQMPGIDGPRAARLIRARERATGGRVPIVAVTAEEGEAERRRSLDAGMDDYLAKPVHPSELFATIARLLKSPAALAIDDGEAVARLASAFVGSVPARLEELHGAAERGDPGAVARLAHALKGSLRAVGAAGAAELAGKLEGLAGGGSLAGAAGLVAALHEEVDRVMGSMRAHLAGPGEMD